MRALTTGGVTRDQWGVPTVYAGSLRELARAQGHVTAIDRAWQLQVERRRSEGRVAEYLGPPGVEWDTFARRSRLDDTARRCHANLDGATREWVSAFVDGVNDGLPEGMARAKEFAAIGAAADVEPWRPWHPLGVFLVQHALFGTIGSKLWRGHVRRSGIDSRLADALCGGFATGPPDGSNGLAVTDGHTASGLPMLAGDPHRLLERPGIYQQVHLICPGVDVLGLAFAGVPGIAHFGHTGDVAWSVTNAMADYQDLYRERLRRDGDGDGVLALGPDGWEPATSTTETVHVRGGSPVDVEIVETVRGPVIVPSWGHEAISVRSPSRVDATLGFEALPALLTARTVTDVETALAAWVEPVNSVLVADRTGTVREFVAGRVPERHRINMDAPVPAWKSVHAWRGTCSSAPSTRVTGSTVHANDERPEVAGLGSAFVAPHRAHRLRELLAGRTGLGVDDVAAMLVDTASGSAPALVELLGWATRDGHGPADGTPDATLRTTILDWDHRADAHSTGAGAYATWRAALVRRVTEQAPLAPVRGATGLPEVFAPWLSITERVGTALGPLLTVLGALGTDVDELARGALADAATGTWGDRHRLRAVHGLDGTTAEGDVARHGDGTPLSGDTDCVLSTASVPGLTDLCLRGPVARYVWDLADRSASRWVVPLGADGATDSAHSADQTPLWAAGALLPVPTTPPTERTRDDRRPHRAQGGSPGQGPAGDRSLRRDPHPPAAHAGARC